MPARVIWKGCCGLMTLEKKTEKRQKELFTYFLAKAVYMNIENTFY